MAFEDKVKKNMEIDRQLFGLLKENLEPEIIKSLLARLPDELRRHLE